MLTQHPLPHLLQICPIDLFLTMTTLLCGRMTILISTYWVSPSVRSSKPHSNGHLSPLKSKIDLCLSFMNKSQRKQFTKKEFTCQSFKCLIKRALQRGKLKGGGGGASVNRQQKLPFPQVVTSLKHHRLSNYTAGAWGGGGGGGGLTNVHLQNTLK